MLLRMQKEKDETKTTQWGRESYRREEARMCSEKRGEKNKDRIQAKRRKGKSWKIREGGK